jgi:hypothetical protein
MPDMTASEKIKTAETRHKAESQRERLRKRLSQQTGTSKYYSRGRPFWRLYYTDGMRLLAREAEARWLIDMIKSYVPSILGQMEETGFGLHTAVLTVEALEEPGSSGRFYLFDHRLTDEEIKAAGGSEAGQQLHQYLHSSYVWQEIPHTDFPLEWIKIVLGPKSSKVVIEDASDVEGVIACLPSEN